MLMWLKVTGLNYFYGIIPSILMNFHVWIKRRHYWLKTDTNHNDEETRLAQPCKSNDLVIQYWTCSLSYFFLLKLNIFAMEKVPYDRFTRSKWILKVWSFLLFFCCWFSTMRMISNLNWQHAVFISSSMFNLWIQYFLW